MAHIQVGDEYRPSFVDRLIFRIGAAIAARIEEVGPAVNTDFASSWKLFDRIGDADYDSTELENRNRWSKLRDLRKMYKGEAKRGNQCAGSITDFHAALQFGMGIRSKDLGTDNPENPSESMAAWDEFLDLNDLDEEGLIDLGVAGELDGQVLMRFQADETVNSVRAWIVPLLATHYQVEYRNPWEPARAVLFPDDHDGRRQELNPAEFAFVRFRGVKDGTYGIPRALRVIEEMEGLHDAIRDWRKINRIFTSPTPIFKAKDTEGLKRIKAAINGMNWKIGMAFAMLAEDDFSLVGMDSGTVDSLEKEIVKLAQFISGATNVPVHYLGFPELMSNRSVADSDMEPALQATVKTHKQWIGFFEEMKVKVFGMLNVMHGRLASNAYDPDDVEVQFPMARKGSEIESLNAWLPAVIAKKVSLQTFHTKVGLDPDDEEVALSKEADAAADAGGGAADDAEARVNQIVLNARRQVEGEG